MDQATVRRLAGLCRLRLTEAEEVRAAARMEKLLAHFATLDEVATDEIEASPYPLAIAHRLREDTVETEAGPLPPEEVLGGAAQTRSGCFRVPRAVDG